MKLPGRDVVKSPARRLPPSAHAGRTNLPALSLGRRSFDIEETSMTKMPDQIAEFLSGKRFAVAGVSRHPGQAANAVFRKLRDSGYEVFPINPNANETESAPCYPNLGSIPGPSDRIIVATHPSVSVELVRQCGARGVGQLWFHRSFGQGSVSNEAIQDCRARGIKFIVGGCPLMYCEPIDVGHQCMRWWLRLRGRVPG
jgi:predicted CoA-binding protein